MPKILSNLPFAAGLGTGNAEDRVLSEPKQGIHGIEAVLEYNGLYMNVRDWIDTYIITQLMGFDDIDVRDSREPNPGQHGETPGLAWYGGRTLVLQGYIETKTLWKMRDMQDALRMAFYDVSQERPLIMRLANPAYDVKINCKKKSKIEMPEEQTTMNDFRRSFNITLAASNPRFLSLQQQSLIQNFSTATYDDIALTPSNIGIAPALPRIEVTGAMGGEVEITNEANGNYIKLNFGTSGLVSDELLVYDFTNQLPRLYLPASGESAFQNLDPLSTDFQLERGANPIRFTCDGMGANASIAIKYNHTYA
jgi:hypothetical protein